MSNYYGVVHVFTKSFSGVEKILLKHCEAFYNAKKVWTIDYEFFMASIFDKFKNIFHIQFVLLKY